MIMYAIFIMLSGVGCFFLLIGLMSAMDTFSIIGSMLGAPGFLPDWLWYFILSWIVMLMVIIGIFFRIKSSGCSKRFDKIPRGKGIFNFIYRDGLSLDLLGMRRPGLGIFDLPQHGVVVDIGRKPEPGSVYRFGDKNIRFALQDINYTPNPKFTSIYSFFSTLGFNTMEELQDVLNGYNPALMAKVWHKLVLYTPPTPEDRIVANIQDMEQKELTSANKDWNAKPKKIKPQPIPVSVDWNEQSEQIDNAITGKRLKFGKR